MSLMSWTLIGAIACMLFGWYLYRRSKNDTPENTDQAADVEDGADDFEDLLLTGILLGEVYDDDEAHDSSDDVDSDDVDSMDDGGFDDSGGVE